MLYNCYLNILLYSWWPTLSSLLGNPGFPGDSRSAAIRGHILFILYMIILGETGNSIYFHDEL